MSTLVYWAFFSGGIAAFSLTLGSLVGLTLRIPSYIIGILAAFGAGALLSALAIELVAPTVEHLVTAETAQEINESKHSFFVINRWMYCWRTSFCSFGSTYRSRWRLS